MINRSTKLTALLLAATSIASMTPAMAVEKLGNKEGTIKEAIAFDGGKYAYQGYRTEDDDTGIWYNKGTEKDTFVQDLEEYEIKSKYGTKYAYVTEDGNKDNYLVDLSTGKVLEDETAEEKQDTAQAKLISALKKSERYNGISDDNNKIDSKYVASTRLFKNQFGDVWYQYVATTDSQIKTDLEEDGVATTTNSSVIGSFDKVAYTGFFNESGKYIDASYTANLKIYNPRKNKATLIEKFGKVYKDEALRANLVSMEALAQDKDYLYVLTTVKVDYFYTVDANGNVTFEYKDGCSVDTHEQTFIQKISKAQGEKTDGAYLPKSVVSYQVDGSMFDNDDINDAEDVIVNKANRFSVVNGKLYATYREDGKVYANVIKLGKDKVDTNTLTIGTKTINVDDLDVAVAILDETGDTKVDDVSIDVDGNVWAIYNGKIMMFDGKEFKDMYACDRSFDRIDVYNKDSLIAWDENSDAYTTVQEGKKQTVNDATEIDPDLGNNGNAEVKTGWEQQADGTWVLYDALGAKVTGWAYVGGAWYYMDAQGIMKTGWLNDNGTWYYLQSSGAMKTGWLNDNGTWYYLNANGSMAANTYVDGYWLNASGAWVK